MKRLISSVLLCTAFASHAQGPAASAAVLPTSPAKKELVQKVLVLQQAGIESVARSLVEQPAVRMMQEAGRALQQQVPAEKREAIGKSIEADVKKYVEESTPIVRDRAIKLAPSTLGTMLEERFTEDELKQLAAWLDSPVNRKYTQLGPEMQGNFTQKLVNDARPLIEPRLQALEAKVRASLGLTPPGASTTAPTSPPAKTAAPAKATPAKPAASK